MNDRIGVRPSAVWACILDLSKTDEKYADFLAIGEMAAFRAMYDTMMPIIQEATNHIDFRTYLDMDGSFLASLLDRFDFEDGGRPVLDGPATDVADEIAHAFYASPAI